MENQVSISVGSRGTLISLIDRELEILQAEKMCSSRSLTPKPNQSTSVPMSPSAFRSSALWQELKGLLKSPTSSQYGASALFCKGAVDTSEGIQETCHVQASDRQCGLARQRSSARRQETSLNQSSQAEYAWWGSNMFGGKKGRNALSKLVRLDSETEDAEVRWHEGYRATEEEESEEDHEFMAKPMLERFHYRSNGNKRECSSSSSSSSSAAGFRVSNAKVVDLQCCYACEASPLPKKSLSFTRLSTLS